jgi:hypothetical protein
LATALDSQFGDNNPLLPIISIGIEAHILSVDDRRSRLEGKET